MNSETFGGAAIAAAIGFGTGLLALITQDGVESIGQISQISWIVLAVGSGIAFGKDAQALSYRRWQKRVVSRETG